MHRQAPDDRSLRTARSGSASGAGRDMAELQARLCAVIDGARAVDIREFETQPVGDFAPALITRVEALLAAGVDALGAVGAHYQDAEPAPDPDRPQAEGFLHEIDRLMGETSSRQRIADLCFVARLELRAKQQPLAALASSTDAWLVLSTCASVRRKLLKSTGAVEQALCELEGLQSRSAQAYATELQVSLEVRRAYTSFRNEILGGGQPDAAVMVQRLRQAGVCIAKLVGRDVYENLRTDDRLQLRRIQGQLLAWLGGSDAFLPRTGLRLWQDLAAFAGMLVTVNNRAELRNHDQATAAEVARLLAATPDAGAPLPDALRTRLVTLRGRDEGLDRLLAPGARPTLDQFRTALLRVCDQLAAPQATATGAQPAPEEADVTSSSNTTPPRPATAGDSELP